MEMQCPIGVRVRSVRRGQNVSQDTLAATAQLNVITISRLETGTAKAVYADTVVALARALRVSTDYLLGLTDVPTPPTAEPAPGS
jgi:transcriptional regulator with XRE-family HTH domain